MYCFVLLLKNRHVHLQLNVTWPGLCMRRRRGKKLNTLWLRTKAFVAGLIQGKWILFQEKPGAVRFSIVRH
jgi:hypothetical protein